MDTADQQALQRQQIARKEFWGTTKASNFAIYGFALGAIGCFLALFKNIAFLGISILAMGAIFYALYVNYQLGFEVRWRLTNFIIHVLFLLSVGIGIGFVILIPMPEF